MAFVLLTMRYIIPPIEQVLEERRKAIAKGLEDSAAAKKQLEKAKEDAEALLEEAKVDAHKFIDEAKTRGIALMDEVKQQAEHERKRLIKAANEEVQQQLISVKAELNQHLSLLIVQGAEALIKKNMSSKQNEKLIDEYLTEI